MKTINKILDYKYSGKILFSMEFILSIINVFIMLKKAITLNVVYKYLFIINGILLSLIMILLFIKYYKKLEYLFLVLVIPLGFSYTTLIIPNQVPDESSHFVKVYTVAEGDFFPTMTKKNIPIMYVPDTLEKSSLKGINNYQELYKALSKKTNYNNKVKSHFDTGGGYAFIDYIIPSLGVNIAKLFNMSIYLGFYLARFLNFLIFILTGFLVLKYIPIGKLFMFVYMFTPMIMQQNTSVSSDSLLNCTSLLFVSYILYLKFNEKYNKLFLKQIIILGVLMIIIASSKIVYFPMIFLIFLLNKKIKNTDKKNKYLLYIIMCLSFFCSIFFYIQISKYSVYLHLDYNKENNIDSIKQLKGVISNPIRYLKVLSNTLVMNQESYLITFVGRSLGCFNIFGAFISVILLYIMFVIAPFLEKSKYEFKKYEKYIINFLVFIIFNTVLGAMYLSWTKVGGRIIEGVQGRYFIPFVFLSFLTAISTKKYINFKRTNLMYFILILCINLNSIYTIYMYFSKSLGV